MFLETSHHRNILFWAKNIPYLEGGGGGKTKRLNFLPTPGNAEFFFLIWVGTEFHLGKILSKFSLKPCPKFYNFYPDKFKGVQGSEKKTWD